ncbi:MAG: metal-sulfur cluster assembly factor [candidate division NC10 bacterium]|nr:metal-sulfur cluster assembly factor [candidate division NC10 bacterium]MDE2485242.1 metal-sulfur cluster assembly factor [candidate division NC10 bacterium]
MTQPGTSPVTEEQVYSTLRKLLDPELGINIVDLGLVYDVQIQGGNVAIRMTLTTRGCPMHASFVQAVERAIRELPGVTGVTAEVVWEPAWNPDMISPEGKRALAGTGRGGPAW